MNKYFAIVSLVASSLVAGQSGTAEAGHGCRTPYYSTQTVTVGQPAPSAVVVSKPAAAAGVNAAAKTSLETTPSETVAGDQANPTAFNQEINRGPEEAVVATNAGQEALLAPTAVISKPVGIMVPHGSTLRLKANFLGREEGQVFLYVNSTSHVCEVIEWSPNYVIVHLPNFSVTRNTPGKIAIATNDGSLKRKVDVIITPTPDVEVVPTDEVPPMAPSEFFHN